MIAIISEVIIPFLFFILLLQLSLKIFKLFPVVVEFLFTVELVLDLVGVLLVEILVKHVQVVCLGLLQHLLQPVVPLA